MSNIVLSEEQQNFISLALQGKNVLVDACIGSGKTTAIQHLCDELPKNKKILYLTYNRLLKIDAKSKITNKNVLVTNYHGYAYMVLHELGLHVGISDLIQAFIKENPSVASYDLLIIDEYQDIDQELSELLEIIKKSNPNIQIVAVGDMEQKIYDKTTLKVSEFISGFLEEYEKIEFTKCFRLSSELAAKLGRIWKKKIVGVNDNCVIEYMNIDEVVQFLSRQNPGDILCLGARNGDLSETLNRLETDYAQTFNKNTVYASISDQDTSDNVDPRVDSAIFTTYDSSKGLERKICVVFDFTESYWSVRIEKAMQSYSILRNIFCVAASRGKEHIIFVQNGEAELTEKTLSTPVIRKQKYHDVNISEMFDFKYKEDVEKCFDLLETVPLQVNDKSLISIENHDGLIDLSPCIGIFQEAVFFRNYSIDDDINLHLFLHRDQDSLYTSSVEESSLEEKILFLTSLETSQKRYRNQVITPFVDDEQKRRLVDRLQTIFTPGDKIQVECSIGFSNIDNGKTLFSALGYADVVKDNLVYELKFVSELRHEHFLQCACYMIALDIKYGILWNTRDNTPFRIFIPDRKAFMDAVTKAITKGMLETYHPSKTKQRIPLNRGFAELNNSALDEVKERTEEISRIAVIDTETNYNDEVMSIGVVIADARTYRVIDEKYYVLSPESYKGGMFSDALRLADCRNPMECSRLSAIHEIIQWLQANNVKSLFAYNASFDKNHLGELSSFNWYDIMRLAANKHYNFAIPQSSECYQNGKLKKNYGVENMSRLLLKSAQYHETHNALHDARDELKIMELLNRPIADYEFALLVDKKKNEMLDRKVVNFPSPQERTVYCCDRVENANTQVSSVAEVAGLLGVSKSKVYNLINRGDIQAVKRGNKYVIDYQSVIDYIEEKQAERRRNQIASFVFAVIIFFVLLKFLF